MNSRDDQGRRAVDAFELVVGTGRGATDARSLARALAASHRELEISHIHLAQAAAEMDHLRAEKTRLTETITSLEGDLGLADHVLDCCRRDRDVARYAAIRAGKRDPLLNTGVEHHGAWTPGRPYLTDQHVYLPRSTAVCFRARVGGAPAGARPGKSSRWQRCVDRACPKPPVVPAGSHPVDSGHALRQEVWWWDSSLRRWALEDLSAEHLLSVIDWLRVYAQDLYAAEFTSARFHVPCPTWAYPSSRSWLADTPLTRIRR